MQYHTLAKEAAKVTQYRKRAKFGETFWQSSLSWFFCSRSDLNKHFLSQAEILRRASFGADEFFYNQVLNSHNKKTPGLS